MSQLKTNFAVSSKYQAFYTGGKIQVSRDGLFMFCGCGNKVNILEVATGKIHVCIGEEEEEEISSFCLTPNDQYLILASQNLLLRQWDWREKKLVRSWKAIHFAPVISMTFDSTSTLLATGSADSTVKVWDIGKQYCTHNLRGHQGIISIVAFHPDITRLVMYSAGEDYKIRVWNLRNSTCIAEIAAHYSLVTCIAFSKHGNLAYTCGRDGVVSIIDTISNTVKKTIPVFEVVESLVLLFENCDYPDISVDSGTVHFITAGNKGALRVWNSDSGKCVFTMDSIHSKNQFVQESVVVKPETDDVQNIVQMVYNAEKNNVTVVTCDQNISILSLEKLRLQKQFTGNNDEILDVRYFGESEDYAIVATNSMLIKVFELHNWDCEILYGHTDIVLCIDVLPKSDIFVSAGKDNTVRLWKINPVLKQVSCLAEGQGHTNAVGAVAVSRSKGKFFVSGSEDCTLKLWPIPDDLDPSVSIEIHASVTEKAHDKTISSVAVAPNDKFIATGSMDKTAKLWKASDLSLIGVMKGHKRGIWCVQFSPVDQVLATSSGDGTVKLWSLADFSCVRTFEGHDCAVLKVTFISRGMQLLTSGTNGLVKLWTVKSNECVKTLDEHEDKVWALTVAEDGDSFLTGAADSSLIIWKDVTEQEQDEAREKQEQFILQEQELSNLIQQKKYLKAIGLAITLEQPYRLLNILKEILTEENGDKKLHETLEKLRLDQIDALLRFSVQWNTNSRHCHEAQVVVACVMKIFPPKQLQELGNLKSSVEGLLPYTERHFNRMSRLVQQSMFLDYTMQCMKGISTLQPATEAEFVSEQTTEPAQKISESGSSESEEDEETLAAVVGKHTTQTTTHPAHTQHRISKTSTRKESASSSDSEESSESETDFIIDRKGENSKQTTGLKAEKNSHGKLGKKTVRDNSARTNNKKVAQSEESDESSESEDIAQHSLTATNSKDEINNNIDSEESSEDDESDDDDDNDDDDDDDIHKGKPRAKRSVLSSKNDKKSDSRKSLKLDSKRHRDKVSVSSVGSEREIYRRVKSGERSTKTLLQDSSVLGDTDIQSEKTVSVKRTTRYKTLEKNKRFVDSDQSDESDQSKAKAQSVQSGLELPVASTPSGILEADRIPAVINTDVVKKKLFKEYIRERSQKGKDVSRKAPKRKLKEVYTGVKVKTPKVIGLSYVEGMFDQQTIKEDDVKMKPREKLAANKLKKLKRPGRR